MCNQASNCSSLKVESFIQELLRGYPFISHASRLGETVLLGIRCTRLLKNCERDVLQPLYGHISEADFYSRLILKGKVYCTESYGRELKTTSYVVVLKNGVVGCIIEIISIIDNCSALVLFEPYNIQQKNSLHSYRPVYLSVKHCLVVEKSGTIITVNCEDIMQKCVVIGKYGNEMDNLILVALQPNTCETD
jgi:hypothetical protein